MTEWLEYDKALEQLMSELITLKLEGLTAEQQSSWNEVFENLKVCHGWLSRWEAGEMCDAWQSEIEIGLKAAREDIDVLKA